MKESAVCYLGMGSPEAPGNIRSIRKFLFNLFNDRHIMPHSKLVRRGLATLISRRSAASSQAKYNLIGGDSPYRVQTFSQTQCLASELEKLGVNIPVLTVFCYTEPSARTVVRQLAQLEIENIVALPQYPQYSSTTTASCIHNLQAEAKPYGINVLPVYAYPRLPGLVEAWTESIWDSLSGDGEEADQPEAKPTEAPGEQSTESDDAQAPERDDTQAPEPTPHEPQERDPSMFDHAHLIFTAHSIPMRCLAQKDPYPEHAKKTAQAIVANLGVDVSWSIAYQSRIQRGEWLGPDIDDVVQACIQKGFKKLVVIPISFLAENLETLYDLDACLSMLVHEASEGQVKFIRVPVPYSSPKLIRALTAVAWKRLKQSMTT